MVPIPPISSGVYAAEIGGVAKENRLVRLVPLQGAFSPFPILAPEKRLINTPYARKEHRENEDPREELCHLHASCFRSSSRFANRESVEREHPVADTMLFQLCPLLSMDRIAAFLFTSS